MTTADTHVGRVEIDLADMYLNQFIWQAVTFGGD